MRSTIAIAQAVLCALLGLALPAVAHAGQTRALAPFAPNPIPGFSAPSGVAIDEATGNVFVTDDAGANAVRIVGPDGNAPVGLNSAEIAGLSFEGEPGAIAYDNVATSPAKGTLYIFQPGSLRKFTRDAIVQEYKPAGEIPAPESGVSAGVAVDSQGNVWLGDFSSQKVREWTPAGVLLREYDLSGSPTNRPSSIAVDAAGDLFVQRPEGAGGPVFKYPSNGAGEVEIANPTLVVSESAAGIATDGNRLAVTLPGGVLEFNATNLEQIEARPFGNAVIGATPERPAYNASTQRLYVADRSPGHNYVVVFGPLVPAPTPNVTVPTAVTGTKATLNGTVNPEGVALDSCVFEYGTASVSENSVACEQTLPPDTSSHIVSANVSGLSPNGTVYRYRITATNVNGSEQSGEETFSTASTVVTEPATDVSTTNATFHGTLRPEGSAYTSCKFEYSLTTSANFDKEVPCSPAAATIPPDFAPHSVSAAVSDLLPNATYRFRLSAENGIGKVDGQALTFSQTGPPQIAELRARDAGESSVIVEGTVNPRKFQTNYFFEWGPTAAYGNRAPLSVTESSAGSGDGPTPVITTLSGLTAGTVYHYRLVARSDAGTTATLDHVLETLNGCGLPEGRCFEMVSPRNPGPVGVPGRPANEEIEFQPGTQSGSLAYSVFAGLSGATRGDQVLYQGTRKPENAGWSSVQFGVPAQVRNETGTTNSNSGKTLGLSPDLSCAIVESNQSLTADPTIHTVVEAGGANLFRRNPDGSYTAITNLPPTNPEAGSGLIGSEYVLAGFSQNCSKAVFATRYSYAGVPAAPLDVGGRNYFLYEWTDGTLRSVGSVPGPTGETPAAAAAGVYAVVNGANVSNSVSASGGRVFFSAERQVSTNPEEDGKIGVFVRENGAVTRDLSLSETPTADLGATYQSAAEDGSRVFFTANSGLTADSSSGGTDLYEYDLAASQLRDLSIEHDAGGAQVRGFIGASADGTTVYFVARGQLAPGRGSTLAQNLAANTFSIYRASDGVVSYAGSATESDIASKGLTVQDQSSPRSGFVSADGRYLLFQSSVPVTGYISGGAAEAYLYDSGAASDAITCVSCRQDGKPSVTPLTNGPLSTMSSKANSNPLGRGTNLTIRNGQPIVFFTSSDRLSADASDGNVNLYQWSHDQVFRIATEPPGLRSSSFEENVAFAGANADGTDLYFATPSSLTWEDSDGRLSVYDARVGGGFPEPPKPPEPCRPDEEPGGENPCQGPLAPGSQSPNAGSASFSGPGNPKHKKQKHKKQKHKKQKHKKQKHKKSASTNGHRGAGK